MGDDVKELVDLYAGMTPENKAHFLALAHATRSSQETTRKSMEKPKKGSTKAAKVTA